ncbi:hypothetical protein BDR03DRAFT_2948 [Suillus americanus]|nr:hypothetical protein BDR03DRAFT_2948 [Suillus americanus]
MPLVLSLFGSSEYSHGNATCTRPSSNKWPPCPTPATSPQKVPLGSRTPGITSSVSASSSSLSYYGLCPVS